jgi:hypothetical protein
MEGGRSIDTAGEAKKNNGNAKSNATENGK